MLIDLKTIVSSNTKTLETTVKSGRATFKSIGVIVEGNYKGKAFVKTKEGVTEMNFDELPNKFKETYKQLYAD